ncbi:MAG: DUF4143 domain-containing protein [Propionibacteriaceae bacterium]|jgi:predicted AAA+ superfamily ATPase|nr:DUF4143 domain-containing protein [Propionibacteriaceae bacterium]
METPGHYRPRLIDSSVNELLRVTGAVAIEGPKWCGKTWTAMTHAASAIWVADPSGDYLTRRIATSDPFSLLESEKPLLIDEWQDAPGLWDAVRLAVDRKPGAGQYLLTGSATPRAGTVSHSGTGRIARLEMWPMTLAEVDKSSGEVSLASVMNGEWPKVTPGVWTLHELLDAILRGGWPGMVDAALADATQLAASYLRSVAYADATMLDGIRRDPKRLIALLSSLSRNTATSVSITTLTRDMAEADSQALSNKSAAAYLDVLRRLHVLREIPAWSPALRSPVRLRVTPKRILCDPSLAAAGLRASAEALMADRKTLGLLFETLCLRDLAVYAEAMGAALAYYHDDAELEADAIVQAGDGRWMGIEIKLGAEQETSAADTLLALRRKMTASGEREPAALMVVTGVDSFPHRRDDGVIVVPINRLGP